ncbi:conserved hypothetical protein, partial [Ricinus communis]
HDSASTHLTHCTGSRIRRAVQCPTTPCEPNSPRVIRNCIRRSRRNPRGQTERAPAERPGVVNRYNGCAIRDTQPEDILMELQLVSALRKARDQAIAERVIVHVDNADGINELVMLAPEDMDEAAAKDLAGEIASKHRHDDIDDLSAAFRERSFVVFTRFATVDR